MRVFNPIVKRLNTRTPVVSSQDLNLSFQIETLKAKSKQSISAIVEGFDVTDLQLTQEGRPHRKYEFRSQKNVSS